MNKKFNIIGCNHDWIDIFFMCYGIGFTNLLSGPGWTPEMDGFYGVDIVQWLLLFMPVYALELWHCEDMLNSCVFICTPLSESTKLVVTFVWNTCFGNCDFISVYEWMCMYYHGYPFNKADSSISVSGYAACNIFTGFFCLDQIDKRKYDYRKYSGCGFRNNRKIYGSYESYNTST